MAAQGEGIQPDVVTTTILVKAQVGSGDVDGGARTLIEMMKSASLKAQLDAFPFNTIIKVRARVYSLPSIVFNSIVKACMLSCLLLHSVSSIET